MLLDNIKRILSGDYQKEHQNSVSQLAEILNYFMEQVTNVINGGLTYENFNMEVKNIEVTVDTSGKPLTGVKFVAGRGLIGHDVINHINLTNNSIFPISKPYITWTTTEAGVYTIRNISGLQANNKYRLTLELKY